MTSSALTSRKWQRLAWAGGAAAHYVAIHYPHLRTIGPTVQLADTPSPPISQTRPSPRSRSYYSFPVPLRVGGWVGAWAHSTLATCSRLLAVDRVWVEPATSRLRVRYSYHHTTAPTYVQKMSHCHCRKLTSRQLCTAKSTNKQINYAVVECYVHKP